MVPTKVNGFHFTRYSGADDPQETLFPTGVRLQAKPATLFRSRTQVLGSTHSSNTASHFQRHLQRGHCNCSAIKLVFPTKEQGCYEQTLGGKPHM